MVEPSWDPQRLKQAPTLIILTIGEPQKTDWTDPKTIDQLSPHFLLFVPYRFNEHLGQRASKKNLTIQMNLTRYRVAPLGQRRRAAAEENLKLG